MGNEKQMYSPGPWKIKYRQSTRKAALPFGITDSDDAQVAIVSSRIGDLENANIIASAPDLLEALREASRALSLIDPLAEHHNAKMIDNALAKARGEQ